MGPRDIYRNRVRFRLSMRFKAKPSLSLKRPKWRKRKEVLLQGTRDKVFVRTQQTKAPTPVRVIPISPLKSSTKANKHKISPIKSPFTRTKSSISANKRKFSPTKSPLTRTRIKMSPLYRHSPLKKKSKKASARSLFGGDNTDTLTCQPILEKNDIVQNETDLKASARSLFGGDNTDTLTCQPILEENDIVQNETDFKASARELFGNDDADVCQTNSDQNDNFLCDASLIFAHEEQRDKGWEDSVLEQMLELTPVVLQKLLEENMGDVILSFYQQVESGAFPLNNLAFLLWTDVVKWFDCSNTSSMRYSEDSKKFWKLGWHLFGGRFVNFMSGFKNESQVVLGDTSKGLYSPQSSDINFAGPSFSVLREFNPYGSIDKREPGLLHDIIDIVSADLNHQSACLTYDGKKLKQGLTESYGDIDILGYETGKTLQDRKDELRNKIQCIHSVQEELKVYMNDTDIRNMNAMSLQNVTGVLRVSLKDLSISIQEVKEIRKKKEFAKAKLIERGGDSNWRNDKYAFAVSAIIAFMHDIDELLKKVLIVLEQICQCIAYLNGTKYLLGDKCNLKFNDSYVELPETENLESTRMIKQRSEKWFDLRKEAKITGSTIYRAIGLDGCGKLKEHFDHVICGVPENKVSAETQKFMDHGTTNEINAVATVVSKVLPVLYPDLVFYEEGCVEFAYVDNSKFMVVSPDGSLRSSCRLDSTLMAVELKCPYYKLQTSLPPRYLLQCLAEIESLNVQSLLYLCWTQDESMVFKVERDSVFFQKAMKMAIDIYCTEKPRKPTKLPPGLKEFREELLEKCKSVEMVGQFKSVLEDTNVCNEYFDAETKLDDLSKLLKKLSESQAGFYEIKREKASEAMVFLCCGLDRIWEKNTLRNAPVCWFPKGYSLSNETLRKVAENVHNQCHKAGIHLPAESFDGQWHNLVVRSIDGKPLTILQQQKDVWHEVEKIQKSLIIKRLREIVIDPVFIRTEIGIVCTNGGIRIPSMPGKRAKLQKTVTAESEQAEASENQLLLSDVIPDKIASSVGVQEEVLEYCALDELAERDALSANINLDVWQNTLSEDINLSQGEPTDRCLSDSEHELSSDMQTLYCDEDTVNMTDKHEASEQTKRVQDTTTTASYKVTYNDAQNILAMFQTDSNSNKKGLWNDKDKTRVLEMLSSKSGLNSLRDVRIRIRIVYW